MVYDEFDTCLENCKGDVTCIGVCASEYDEKLPNCPCNENCICKLFKNVNNNEQGNEQVNYNEQGCGLGDDATGIS